MNEQDVRALVREAVERHMGRPDQGARGKGQGANSTSLTLYPSHAFLTVLPGSEAEDGMCIIEPRVLCSHCGFCQSFGH